MSFPSVCSNIALMTTQHQRGVRLARSLYADVVANLKDDYEMVRLEAVTVVWVLATVYADEQVAVEGAELRLIDSGFATVCGALVYSGGLSCGC